MRYRVITPSGESRRAQPGGREDGLMFNPRTVCLHGIAMASITLDSNLTERKYYSGFKCDGDHHCRSNVEPAVQNVLNHAIMIARPLARDLERAVEIGESFSSSFFKPISIGYK